MTSVDAINNIVHLYPKFWESPTQYTFETTIEALELNSMSNKTIAIFIVSVVDKHPLIIPNKYKDLKLVKPRYVTEFLSCCDLIWRIQFNRSKKYIDGFFAAYLATGDDEIKAEICDLSDIAGDPYGRSLFGMLVE